jgi:outer membrane assembly lipoprotein YfiO
MRPRRALPCLLAVLLAAAPARHAAALRLPFKSPSHSTPQEQFEYAESLEQSGNLVRATDAYQKLVDDFGESALAAEAQFRVAELLERAKQYYPAFNAYQAVLDKFPSYPKVNLILERQFKIGNLFLKGTTVGFLSINPGGSRKRAIAIFKKILSNAPFSELAPSAQYNLGLAYMEMKNYTEAAIELEKIPARYPRCDFVATAKFQLGVCAYRKAIAAQYDQEAAQEAINKLQEYLAEFPADKNAELAKNMVSELQGRKAAALYEIGCYYQRRNNPRAALIYLEEVARDYPLASCGESARKMAKRERRRLELSELVKKAQDAAAEIERLIASQESAIGKIKARGRARWAFWRRVVPRTLAPGEALEVERRREKIAALRERLALARVDVNEAGALSRNRMTLLDAEVSVEKAEDALRAAQLDLQVAQSKLSDIGALPEAESTIVENAAKAIAAKEDLARRQAAEIERLRAGLEEVERRSLAEERRIKEYYAGQRAVLAAKEGKPAAAAAGRRWPWKLAGAPLPAAGGEAARRSLADRIGLRRLWPFGGAGRGAGAGGEEARLEAEELIRRAGRGMLEGRLKEAGEDFERASRLLEGIRASTPDYRSVEVLTALERCREGLKEARRESAAKQYAEISADLLERVAKDPNDADALFTLGAISRGHGDSGKAIDCFRRVIALKPEDADAWRELGLSCAAGGDLANAAASLRKAVEKAPGNARVRHELGLVYGELGDHGAARSAFEEALKADASYAPAWFSLGRLYQSAFGDRAKAVECWEKYLKLDPGAPAAAQIGEWIAHQRAPAEMRSSTAAAEPAPAVGGWRKMLRMGR